MIQAVQDLKSAIASLDIAMQKHDWEAATRSVQRAAAIDPAIVSSGFADAVVVCGDPRFFLKAPLTPSLRSPPPTFPPRQQQRSHSCAHRCLRPSSHPSARLLLQTTRTTSTASSSCSR